MLKLNLPFPPSVNTYWRRHGNRYFISKRGVDFKNKALLCLPSSVEKFTGFVVMQIHLYPPNKRKVDIDNMCKAVLDFCQFACIFADDYQVSKLIVERFEPSPPGSCIVIIDSIS